jgi:hypothetical protein
LTPGKDYTDLYPTGVDNDYKKLGENKYDTHYIAIGQSWAYNGADACQRVQIGNTSTQIKPSVSKPVSAVTIAEKGTRAGYSNKADASYTWGVVKPSARWIGFNESGQHASIAAAYNNPFRVSGCTEPAESQSGINDYDHNPRYFIRFNYELANGGFSIINPIVDLNNIQLKMTTYVDNWIGVTINNTALTPYTTVGSSFLASNWMLDGVVYAIPGHQTPPPVYFTGANVFKLGLNPMKIDLLSTPSHEGFMISEISLQGSFWDLEPDIKLNNDTPTIVSGEPVSVGTNVVRSASSDQQVTRHRTQLTRCVYPSSTNFTKSYNITESTDVYSATRPECSVVNDVPASSSVTLGTNNTGSYTDEGTNFSLGDTICYIYSVYNFNANNAIANPSTPNSFIWNQYWRHSAPTCVRINQTAGLSIRGADAWSGGKFASSSSMNSAACAVSDGHAGGFIASRPFANMSSWAQYGLFSLGKIDDSFGSGGWTAALAGRGDTDKSLKLKFANNGESRGTFYGLSPKHCLTDLYNYYDRLSAGGGSTAITKYYSDYVINTGWTIVDSGRQIVLIDGDLTINGNIVSNRAGQLSKLTDVPEQLILVNGNINISGNVNRIDATLMARSSGNVGGVIDTCYQGDNAVPLNAQFSNTGVCYNQLVINGALIGDSIRLKRTWGPVKMNEYSWGSVKTAEIVNYSIATPLTDFYYRTGRATGIRTVLYREAAPRV